MDNIIKTEINSVISTDTALAAKLLKAGEVVALPTETVYGLAGNALDKDAVARIFSVKQRPQDNPLIVHASDMDMVKSLKLEIPPLAETLAEKFWGGALTMVLKRQADCVIPGEVSCGLDTVAVRVPNNAVMRDVIKQCGFPLAAPSANLSGRPSPTKASHVFDDLNGRIPLIIDGGDCEIGIESTVIAFDGNCVNILRAGEITAAMLSAFAETRVIEHCESGSGIKPMSPGVAYKHYSPNAEVIAVIASTEKAFHNYVNSHLNNSDKTAIIANPTAKTLFAQFREFDKTGAERVYVRLSPENTKETKTGLYDRITRAADKTVYAKKRIIGLTGMSGSGKSEASKILRERDIYVLDCDPTANKVIASSPCVDEVRLNFPQAFNEDGMFDRKKAAKFLFSVPERLKRYEKIVFPYVTFAIIGILAGEHAAGNTILLDAPTLFQSGLDDFCDCIIAVVAERDICVKRIVERDNISEHDALMRLNNQHDENYFRRNANYIIENNKSLEEFVQRTEQIFHETVIND